MYDLLICKKKLPVSENFLNRKWDQEPFRTSSLTKNFNNYIISKDGFLFRQNGDNLEKINYHGFVHFSTHFFDDQNTQQYYISFFSSFDKGVLEELSLEGFKEYKLENYNLEKFLPKQAPEISYNTNNNSLFWKTANLIRSYFKKT